MRIIAAPDPQFPLAPDVLTLADAQIDSMTEFNLALVEKVGTRSAGY